MAKKLGLGKGLDSLIPSTPAVTESKKTSKTAEKAEKTEKAKASEKTLEGVILVNITKVEPDREQPRKKFDEDALQDLADSISKNGLLQPILVQDCKDHYEIIAGERRWRASKLAGLKEIPVIVKNYTKQQRAEIALIENLQREDLNEIEEAQAYKRLMEEFNLRQDEVADKVNKSRSAITNSLRLLKLCEEVQQMLIDDKITAGHARALLSVSDAAKQLELAEMVMDQKLSVRDIEKLVKKLDAPSKKPVERVADDETMKLIYSSMEERLKSSTGTKVSISGKGNGAGTITIEFYSNDDLERIADLLQKN